MNIGLLMILVGIVVCMGSHHFSTKAGQLGGIDWFRKESTEAEFNGKMAYGVMLVGVCILTLGAMIL